MLLGILSHTNRWFKRVVQQYVDFDGAVIEIRMCRPDLSERVIKEEVKKIASEGTGTILGVAYYCVDLAKEGKPMPWEKDTYSKLTIK